MSVLSDVLQFMYPESRPLVDWETTADGESADAKAWISAWRLPVSPPTYSEVQAIATSKGFIAWKQDRGAAAIDRDTDLAICAALHPFVPRGEEAAIHREQLQAILNTLGMMPIEKFARLANIAHKFVAAGQETKATAAKAG